MKKMRLLLISLTLAVVAVIAVGAVAFAAGPNGQTNSGVCPSGSGVNSADAVCLDVAADLSGLTVEEIQTQRQAGLSLVQIVAEKGITETQLVDAIMTGKKDAVQAQVEAGTLTQERADLMLQNMEQMTVRAVNQTTFGPPAGIRSYGHGQSGEGTGPGMMRQYGAQDGCGNGYGSSGTGNGPGMMNRWASAS